MSAPSLPGDTPQRLTFVQWLILIVATIGFMFDTYALLTTPLIARPALAQLLHVDPATTEGTNAISFWTGWIFWSTAVSGGVFGLLGGYLTDRFGRRAVLVWSILLYAVSSVGAAFATSVWMLLVLRCTTFIGVCVEFVAAVAWLAELFPNPRQRESVLGFTQAFSSFGGLLVAGTNFLAERYAEALPAIVPGTNNAWRWTLISGLLPALPVIIIRPFLPESPAWKQKKEQGTLRRPSFSALFAPGFARTTIVTTAMFACSFGAAFGAIQLTPQMVPGLVPEAKEIPRLRKQLESLPPDSPEVKDVRREIIKHSQAVGETAASVQFFQEIGGLVGRFALAGLALWIVSRRNLLRVFQLPGLVLIPLVYLYPATGRMSGDNLEWLKVGLFVAGFFTVAQFSFWGNYLPRMYPTYLRGTGESFAANIGGRMLGTAAAVATTSLARFMPVSAAGPPSRLAFAAAAVVFAVYLLGTLLCFALPEPKGEHLMD